MLPKDNAIGLLAEGIAGEITLADNPGAVMKKWRNKLKITQKDLASFLNVSPSVISDNESGRRNSPRMETIRKFVEAIILLDYKKGGGTINAFKRILGLEIPSDCLLAIREFPVPVKLSTFCEHLECDVLACPALLDQNIFGYTAIDSINAILNLTPQQMLQLYGTTPKRVAIFTNVHKGRSPMVAIKTSQMGLGAPGIKPAAVVLHGVDRTDPLAIRIAESERIPLAVSAIDTREGLIKRLREFLPPSL
ncbi:MAG: helix-turn-helix domain-containing protein [Promethearchaeota archaeon]